MAQTIMMQDKNSANVARKLFPLLVRQAHAQQRVFYSDLCRELGLKGDRALSHPLGIIADALREHSKGPRGYIPPIGAVVIDKTNLLPSDGFVYALEDIDYPSMPTLEKRRIALRFQKEVYDYPHWDKVLLELGLEPAPQFNFRILFEKMATTKYPGGEGPEHKELKKFVVENPSCVGVKGKPLVARTEYPLPSGDSLDVFFEEENGDWVGVEVKSRISNDNDLIRGIFQCIKYKAVLEAKRFAEEHKPFDPLIPGVRVILIVGRELVESHIKLRNMFGTDIQVILDGSAAKLKKT